MFLEKKKLRTGARKAAFHLLTRKATAELPVKLASDWALLLERSHAWIWTCWPNVLVRWPKEWILLLEKTPVPAASGSMLRIPLGSRKGWNKRVLYFEMCFEHCTVYSYLPEVPLKILFFLQSQWSWYMHLPCHFQYFPPWTEVWLRPDSLARAMFRQYSCWVKHWLYLEALSAVGEVRQEPCGGAGLVHEMLMCLYIQLLKSGKCHMHWNVFCSECAETWADNLAPGWAEFVLKCLLVELGFRKLYAFIPVERPSTGERVVWTMLPGDGTGSSWQVL